MGPGWGDSALPPAFFCVACHRPSGFGSIEGATPVPAITGSALFAPRRMNRAEAFRRLYQEDQAEPFSARARAPRLRPAYDVESLTTALQRGHDPSGRVLDPWMPRYEIGVEDVAHLAAYLRTLGQIPDPGVEDVRIHFATVIDAGAEVTRRRAVLEVIHAYIRRKNLEVRGRRAHSGASPWYRDEFADTWREWELHEWELRGPPHSWPDQLRTLQAENPVFAVLGGLVEGSFAPIHQFCEEEQIPCLFPQTDLPVTSKPGRYTLYLSPGIEGEAEALATYLATDEANAEPPRVVQVVRDEPRSRAAARSFAMAWDHPGFSEVRLGAEESLDWHRVDRHDPEVLILWLAPGDLAALETRARRVFLSTSLVGVAPELAESLRPRIHLTHRFALPGQEAPRIYRVRAWLRSRGVRPSAHERAQLDTYLALSVADHALGHLVTRYDRDFFVESVEHEMENELNPGTYPRLGLGPGQRFASKGAWIVRLGTGGLEPVSPWIVPDRR